MELFNTYTILHLGITIIHSLWQVGTIAFIYFYFLLITRKLNMKQKYTAGLICLVVILFSFIITFLLLSSQNNKLLLEPSESINEFTLKKLLVENWFKEEIVDTGSVAERFKTSFAKFRLLLYRVAGVIGGIWVMGVFFSCLESFRGIIP